MAGGSGVRRWPYSREARPKQFLAFNGQGTLLQQTAKKLRGQTTWTPEFGWGRLDVAQAVAKAKVAGTHRRQPSRTAGASKRKRSR